MTETTELAQSVPGANSETAAQPRLSSQATWPSVGALSLAATQAVCAGLVLLKGVSLFTALFGLMAAGAGSSLHRDLVRIPVMTLAGAVALANLYTAWNGWRLRRLPAARWRVRPLSTAERRRLALVLTASFLTLALLAAEIYGHYALHAR
ncbi:MAG TPA: hypothetical protein VNK82_12035 [Terriglobales bacterium]|nr:hypothetical protein [Terriglobales bacterium]